jgi:hypothetical protein
MTKANPNPHMLIRRQAAPDGGKAPTSIEAIFVSQKCAEERKKNIPDSSFSLHHHSVSSGN